MNLTIINAMVYKDLYLNRWPLLAYIVVGFIALSVMASNIENSFYIAIVLIISMIIIVGAHLVFTTVINERKMKTLPFMMSLPISYFDYTLSKLISNIGGFLLIWLVIVSGVFVVVTSNEQLPNGLIPYITIILLELFVAHMLVFTVALISESEACAIVVMAICNISVSLFGMFVGRYPGIKEYIEGAMPVWNNPAIAMVSIEISIIVLLIGMVFYAQSRKKNFI